jgi:hypothetical protein
VALSARLIDSFYRRTRKKKHGRTRRRKSGSFLRTGYLKAQGEIESETNKIGSEAAAFVLQWESGIGKEAGAGRHGFKLKSLLDHHSSRPVCFLWSVYRLRKIPTFL